MTKYDGIESSDNVETYLRSVLEQQGAVSE
jgi:hypothetical protein